MPKLVTWAAATSDIELLAKRLWGEGFGIEGPQLGSRMRPDGRPLQWKTIRLADQPYGLIPFFIQWASDTVHPSVDSPPGCRLTGLEFAHPQPDVVTQMLQKLGIVAEIESSCEPAIRICVNGPKGKVLLA